MVDLPTLATEASLRPFALRFPVSEFLANGTIQSVDFERVCVAWGVPTFHEEPDRSGYWVYAPDFFRLDLKPWLLFPNSTEVEIDEVLGCISAHDANVSGPWTKPEKSAFAVEFETIKKLIHSGKLKKAVPIVRCTKEGAPKADELRTILDGALKASKNFPLTTYGVWFENPDSHLPEGIVGATPELLFEMQSDRKVHTMALAGTRPKSVIGQKLLLDPKEREEHQIVIDDIQRLLSEIGLVHVGETMEMVLPTLIHLQTQIDLVAHHGVSFDQLVARLHPTPAIGGAPSFDAIELLRSLPSAAWRNRFGAAFASFITDGTVPRTPVRCVLAIRNVQWANDLTTLAAGCGIVRDSILEREWRELASKMEAVMSALSL